MKKNSKGVKLAVTGGIGSGKSYVSALLKECNIPIYNSDAEAKRLMTESPIVKGRLPEMVGAEVYLADGTLNRGLLAEWMFASTERVKCVNALVHPIVKADFQSWAERQNVPVVAMECAILYESGFDALVDKVLLVTAPEQMRIERVVKRDNVTTEQVKSRMAAQMSDEVKIQKADYVLVNDGMTDVRHEISDILHRLLDELSSDSSD